MVHIINLGVGLVLAAVLVVGFCLRHKWTNGKSIFGHLLKGKIGDLIGKAKSKRRDHKTEKSSVRQGNEKNDGTKLAEIEVDHVDFEDEAKRAQEDGFITKNLDESNCKGTKQNIEAQVVELPEEDESSKDLDENNCKEPETEAHKVELLEDGGSLKQVVADAINQADARGGNISTEEPTQ